MTAVSVAVGSAPPIQLPGRFQLPPRELPQRTAAADASEVQENSRARPANAGHVQWRDIGTPHECPRAADGGPAPGGTRGDNYASCASCTSGDAIFCSTMKTFSTENRRMRPNARTSEQPGDRVTSLRRS